MATSGSGSHNLNQHPPAVNANQTLLRTIPPDFRFKTIGQAPGLLNRITTPDPEIPLSPSPSPLSSPQLDSLQILQPDNQAQMKPKASLLERITGSSTALPPQAEAAGPSQSIFTARATQVNTLTETAHATAASTQPRSASLETPSPDDNLNTASRTLPKLDTAPEAPPLNSAMDVDTPVNGGPGSEQALPSTLTSDKVADPNMATSASPTARKASQSAGGQSLSPYAALRNRIDGISEALSNLPAVNTGEAAHLLELATTQSAAALQSANHAQERTTKALECLQEAMKVVADCITSVQESDTRTNAAIAAVAALTGTRYEEERQRFVAPILHELAECRQSLDRMEELYQKQRQVRAQRQMQAAAPSVPATTAPATEYAATPAAVSSTAPAVIPAADAPASSVAPHPAPYPYSNSSALASGFNATGTGSQAVEALSTNGDEEPSPALIREQKMEDEELSVEEGMRLLAEQRKAFTEDVEKQKRRQDEFEARIYGILARSKQKAPAADAQNVQTMYAESSSQIRQPADDQTNDDRMTVDGENKLQHSQDESQAPAAQSEIRQRMIKARLEAERQAAERLRSDEDKLEEASTLVVDENLTMQNDEDGHGREVQQKLFTVTEGAKNTNNRRVLVHQTSPTENVRAPVQPKNESAIQTTGTLAAPNATKLSRPTGAVVSGNISVGAVDVDTKNRPPSQSRRNTSSPTARYRPLPDDSGHTQKHRQRVATVERSQLDPAITTNAIPIPATLAVGLPPHPQPLVRQGQMLIQNFAAARAVPTTFHQVTASSSTNQHVSRPIPNSQESPVVIKREPDQDDEETQPAQWDTGAPMTPDSLPSEHGIGHNGDSHQIKREGSISIPRLSLPSPPPATAPPATVSAVFSQTFGQQYEAVNDSRPELLPRVQTTHIASRTEQLNGFNLPNLAGSGQNIQPFFPSGSPSDESPSIPATQPVAVHRKFTPTSPRFTAMDYPPSVPALIVTEADTEARTNVESERGRAQSIPESHSLNSFNGDRSSRSRLGPQRRIGSDHYSPPPPPRRSRSRSRSSRPLPARGDHYSPRRQPSPAPGYSGGYSRYPGDRPQSRGPISATNSRNASPNPYAPPIGHRQPPLAPANHGQKRSHAGDMPQGPPARKPRYDESHDNVMQANSSRLYIPGREIRDERSVIANRAPSPAEYRPRPLEERLGYNAPSDGPQSRGRQLNYDSNSRYDNRKPFSDYAEGPSAYDSRPDRRPPPSYQEIPSPPNAISAASRPDLLSRLGNGNSSHDDSDYNSQFHRQPTNNHPSNYHSTRGGLNPRRGRGAGPTTPRGGKSSLINRIGG